MTEQQTTLAEQAMQVAREMAIACRMTEDETLDAISHAWEFALNGPTIPVSIAWYAIRRVRSARRFRGESVRSIDSPQRRPDKPERSNVNLNDLAKPGSNPATIAGLKIDFEAWLHNLPERPRRVAEALATGCQTGELAKQLGVSPGRISQIRRELEADWQEFQG